MLMSSDEAALIRYEIYMFIFFIEIVLWCSNLKGHHLPSNISLISLGYQTILLLKYTIILCGRTNNLDAVSFTFKWLHYFVVIVGLAFVSVYYEINITVIKD